MQSHEVGVRKIRIRGSLIACLLVASLGYLNIQIQGSRLPADGRLDAIYFENEDHGFVRLCCGNMPEIYETLDGGHSWKYTDRPIHGLRRGRVLVDPSIGWSVVEDAWPHTSLYQTTDGGKTWKHVLHSETKGNFYVDAIQAVSGSDVWVLGLDSYHTSDGGRTWQKLHPGYISLDFLDAHNGWTLGGGVWRTTDGGQTWRTFPIPNSLLPGKTDYELCDIYFLSSRQGWVVGGMIEENLPDGKQHGVLLTTSDGGETWTLLAHFEDHFLWSVFFLNEKVGWVAGLNGTFLRTTDAGKTWFDARTGQTVRISSAAAK